jgi:serine/threonine protein kinase
MKASPEEKDRWRVLMEILDAAAELPPEQRDAYIESCGCGPDIRREVRELLAGLERTGEATPRPGERFGKYEVTGVLGRGGMGEVYSARDTDLNRGVALKFLALDALADRSGIDTLIREAHALSALNHPNIVTVYEVIRSGPSCAIAMELVEGEPLRKKTGEALPAAAVAEIGRQIAGALAAAHARGIIHRDIKPENILVRADGYIKILDFGLARRIDAESLHSGVGIPAGTVRYMSPEQAFGKPITTATDVFSLGLVLYELATARHPFAASSVFETAHAIASEDPDPPTSVNPKLPPALDALLLRMLAKEARLRPSAAEVAHQLSGPSLAGQAAPAAASSRKISRRRVIASASVAGIAGAGLYAWRSTRTGADNLRLLVDKGESRDPCFSPDGARVAFSWKPAGSDRFQLAWIATGGGEPRPLTSGRADDIGPAWSPDGQRIAFLRQGARESALYVKQLKDGTERRVTTMTTSIYGNRIDWLRDSRTVVMARAGSARRLHSSTWRRAHAGTFRP